MTEQQAMRMALEALEGFIPYLPIEHDKPQCDRYDKAITALRQALAEHDSRTLYREGYVNGYAFGEAAGKKQALEQQQDEPVALRETLNRFLADKGVYLSRESIDDFMQRLNTRPQPAAWVGLTNVEIGTIAYNINPLDGITDFARAIEAKLKEKNT